MKLPLLVSCAGLAAGAVAGWLTRPAASAASAKAAGAVVKALADTNIEQSPDGSAAPAAPLTTAEILKICEGKDGDLTLYEKLGGVPVRTLLAILDDLPLSGAGTTLDWDTGYRARSAMVERLAELDPGALAQWLLHGSPGMVSTWTNTAIQALLERNPPGAAGWIDRLEQKAPGAASARVEWLAKRDPEAALQKLLAGSKQFMPEVLAGWLAGDPARALTFSNTHPELSYFVLAAMKEQDGAALEKLAVNLTHPDAQHQARRLLLGQAATKGDAETFKQLLVKEGIADADSLQDEAIESMARLHPEKAEALAGELAGRPELAIPLMNEYAASHPERAAAFLASSSWLRSVPEAQQGVRDSMLRGMSFSWSLTDPAAALTWVRALPPEERAVVLPQSIAIGDQMPPEQWLSLSRGLAVNAEGANRLVRQSVAHTKDPAVLAEWCASFPDNFHAAMLESLRNELKDPALSLEITRRLESVTSPENP